MQIFTAGKILGVCLFRGIDRNDDDNGNDTASGGVVAIRNRLFYFVLRSHIRQSPRSSGFHPPIPPIFGGLSSVQNTADSKT